ncbi:hypothetical protein V496_07737 [Pseudogymnoascus sp. VKM F-4515 (FW-2607)]|nr:hypothetical protein V496_07737 [Pseudogymnoascus sp. VKM F-4515 (FW-2607)]KFY92915.1 hypothetical protein V498_04667 [Pseudogymnoascus sp. VKM F-4517 (FW-2822)]
MASNIVYLDESPLPAERYNSLPHIDYNKDAATLYKSGRNKLLGLISSHKLQDTFSVHLVHKHFDLPENRVMVYEMIKGSAGHPGFQISSPRAPSTCKNLHGVYFTAATGGRMVAYEYTTDPLVDISNHNDFFRQFSNLVMELGLQNVYALTVRYLEGPPLLHEFEMPDLGSTVLVPDASWIPGSEGSVSTDWGFLTTSGDFSDAAVRSRCTVTRSNKHYEITKYEPGDSETGEGVGGEIISFTRCIETRSGAHHERAKRHSEGAGEAESDSLMINGEPLLPGSAVFGIVTHARQLISTF